ncbi:MAG: hypothetical protein AAGF01_17625 [Cyanobacteria bacterium P01_G01_bin.38]
MSGGWGDGGTRGTRGRGDGEDRGDYKDVETVTALGTPERDQPIYPPHSPFPTIPI